MSESQLAEVERVLGHRVDPAWAASIHDLNEIPADVLADARSLRSYVLRTMLMRYVTPPPLHRMLPDFVDEVLAREVDPRAWRRGGFLFPSLSLDTLVTLGIPEVLAVLGRKPHEHWLQYPPDRRNWEIEEDTIGAPGVERPELRYDSEVPAGVRRHFHGRVEGLWQVDDVAVATRRWMGSRIAARARTQGGLERFDEPQALLRALFPQVGGFSSDATIATRAVQREAQAFGTDGGVPGFLGPAEWFA